MTAATPRPWESGKGLRSHGVTGYRRGCRCGLCRAANTRKGTADRIARGARTDAAPHGTVTAYSNWGCRCDPCRAAGSEWNRRNKARLAARRSLS